MNFTENEKRTIRENQLCLDNESMSMKLELLFTENKRLREALKYITTGNIDVITNTIRFHGMHIDLLTFLKLGRDLAKQALGE